MKWPPRKTHYMNDDGLIDQGRPMANKAKRQRIPAVWQEHPPNANKKTRIAMTYGTCLDPNLGHKCCNSSFVAIVHVLLRGQAIGCDERTPE